MTYRRDTTLDLLNKFDDGTFHGLLQVTEGAYDVYGVTVSEFIQEGKNLADFLGVTIDMFNTDLENITPTEDTMTIEEILAELDGL